MQFICDHIVVAGVPWNFFWNDVCGGGDGVGGVAGVSAGVGVGGGGGSEQTSYLSRAPRAVPV